MAQQLVLDKQGIENSSNELKTLSADISEMCKAMYGEISELKETEAFKTVDASGTYYETIDRLNGVVPKYTEDVLKFSEFLSNYVITNYQETDEEMKQQVESNLDESLAQLDNVKELGNGVNLDKISTSAQGALNGDFVDSSKLKKSMFEDGELEFKVRDDGSVQIMKNGTILGFTTQDGVTSGNVSSASSTPVQAPEQTGNIDMNPISEASTNTTESTVTDTSSATTVQATSASPSTGDYKTYKFEMSNKIAEAARAKGFSDEQVDIAVGISRLETGNYTSKKSQNHNYGGMRSGDGWARFETEEEGIDAYLNNLNKNYFSQGLNTPETIQPKYAPSFENDGEAWINNVYGCMK